MKVLLVWALIASSTCFAEFEVQTNVLPSVALVGHNDLVFSSHNTLLFGTSFAKLGAYGSFESISQTVTDTSYGGAVRFGNEQYFEIQGGYFERKFSQFTQRLKGRGYAGNLIYGFHLNPNFGIAAFLEYKRITSGDLDKRTIVELLPFLTLRVAL